MSLVRCTGCGQRIAEKPTTVYWGWRLADGRRSAWRSKLCPECVTWKIVPLNVERDPEERLTCPQCGIDTEDDMDPVYGAVYFPRYGREDVEAPFCGPCAAVYRIWIQERSARLDDRLEAGAGLQPPPSGVETLEALGWIPRRVQYDQPT